VAAVAAIGAGLIGFGAAFVSGPPSSGGVYGRTGWVTCPKQSPSDVQQGKPKPVPPEC
jgi:hypothetical protein